MRVKVQSPIRPQRSARDNPADTTATFLYDGALSALWRRALAFLILLSNCVTLVLALAKAYISRTRRKASRRAPVRRDSKRNESQYADYCVVWHGTQAPPSTTQASAKLGFRGVTYLVVRGPLHRSFHASAIPSCIAEASPAPRCIQPKGALRRPANREGDWVRGARAKTNSRMERRSP